MAVNNTPVDNEVFGSAADGDTPANPGIGAVWRQANESETVDGEGTDTFNYVCKGNYASLQAIKAGLWPGRPVVDGWIAKSWQLQKGRGGSGTLTITCGPAPQEDEPSEGSAQGEQVPLKETWSIKSVRNDVSILAYCGTETNSPQRAQIEQWMKEPDGNLAAGFEYREADGKVRSLDDGTPGNVPLAQKIAKGIETVMRFYPQLTRKRVYSVPPNDCLENLATVDTPDFTTNCPDGKLKKPKNLTSATIDRYDWLKCQDDEDEQSDGTWARIESWIGALKSEGGWDENLYGTTNRWTMPYNGNQDVGGGDD